MKKIIIICLLSSLTTHLIAQGVGVGTLTPNQSAVLDLTSTTKGVLIPRMTTAQRDVIVTPAAGLQILNLDDYCLDIYDGDGWIKNCGFRVIGTDTTASTVKDIANFSGIARSDAVAFTIAGKGYVGTGYDGANRKKDFWQYNPATNVWTQKADFGGTARASAVGFEIQNLGYIGTGWDGQYRSDFWVYWPGQNYWEQKANVPGGNRLEAVGFKIGETGFIGLGYNPASDTYFSDMWAYDFFSDAWYPKTSCPYKLRSSVAFGWDILGFISTGIRRQSSTDVYEDIMLQFNPAGSGTWTSLAHFPGARRSDAVGFSLGQRCYVGTGKSQSGTYFKDLWEYDIYTDSWQAMPNVGTSGRANAVTFDIGGVSYIGTGYDGSYLSDFKAFEPYPLGPLYENTLDIETAAGINDGVWNEELDKISTEHRIDIAAASRTLTHPDSRPFYFSGDMGTWSDGAEFCKSDGRQGIGIGLNYLYAAGTDASQNIGLWAKGMLGEIKLVAGGNDRITINPNGNIGISNPFPHGLLHFLNFSTNRKIILYEPSNTNNDFQFSGLGNNAGTIRYQVDATTSDHIFLAGVNASTSDELMRIKGNGSVGIGLTNPQNKLDINIGPIRSGTHATGLPLYVTGISGASSGGVEFRHSNSAQGIGFGYNTIYAAGSDVNHSLGMTAKGATGNLVFTTNSAERVKIAGDGKVGIGITSPQNKLDINGGGTRTGTHPTSLPMYVTGITGAASGGVEFRHDNGTQGIGIGYNTIYTSGSNTDQVLGLSAKGAAGHLIFSTNAVERMRITGSGEVGIGTSTPNAQLQLATSVANRKIVLYDVNSNSDHEYHGFGINGDGSLRYQTANMLNDHAFFAATSSTNSTELLRIKGNGNLQVAGVIETDGFTVPTLLNNFTNYGAGYAGVAFYKDKMGRVFLRGLTNNVNNPTGLVVFNLPAGYRPSASGKLVFSTISNNALGRVDVLPNGDVVVNLGSAGWISLDNISFKAD